MDQSHARNSLLILTIIVCAGMLIFLSYSMMKTLPLHTSIVQNQYLNGMKTGQPGLSANSESTPSPDQYILVNPNKHARSKIRDNKELAGTVNEMFDPSGDDTTRLITLDSEIIDTEKIDSIDFSRKTNDLPMKKQTFQVIITSTTKIEGGTIQELSPGEVIHVTSKERIYDKEVIVAEIIKFVPSAENN